MKEKTGFQFEMCAVFTLWCIPFWRAWNAADWQNMERTWASCFWRLSWIIIFRMIDRNGEPLETAELYNRQEFIELLKVADGELGEWENLGLVRPVKGGDSGDDLYTADNVREAQHIKGFLELGYDLPSIQKIVIKIGLPDQQKNKKKRNATRKLITVGDLAKRSGLNTRTIRYWEERGILNPDARSAGGYRLYSEQTVEFCLLIRDLQVFGFSLEEIKRGADLLRDFFVLIEGGLPVEEERLPERLDVMLKHIGILEDRMIVIKEGVKRWDDLLKKRKKEIVRIRDRSLNDRGKHKK